MRAPRPTVRTTDRMESRPIGSLGPAQDAIIWMIGPLDVPATVSFAMSTLFILLGFAANLPGAAPYPGRR